MQSRDTRERERDTLYERDEISELNIDLCGDGCEIGGVGHTRLCFRILQDFSDKITAQSSSITFCFSGKLWLFLLILYFPSAT